jgi:hypothetical protein
MYVEKVFTSPYQWGRNKRPPHVVMDTLSHGRPRWAVQLSRLAGVTAAQERHATIELQDVVDNLVEYGQKRVADLEREHSHQCQETGEMIAAFAKQRAKYQTDELVKLIKNRICEHFAPHIEGNEVSDPVAIAQFLFRIGFLTARDDLDEDDYRHYTYQDLPQLLQNRANLDFGYSWEIHPCFRQFLHLEKFIPSARKRWRR